MMDFKKDVVYYFDEMIGTYHYAFAHPMKPLRVAMTDEIVKKYQLDQHFDTIVHSLPSRTSNSQR
jgi:histone deacetylase 1/2